MGCPAGVFTQHTNSPERAARRNCISKESQERERRRHSARLRESPPTHFLPRHLIQPLWAARKARVPSVWYLIHVWKWRCGVVSSKREGRGTWENLRRDKKLVTQHRETDK